MALITTFSPNLGFCLKSHPAKSHNLQVCSKAVPLIPRKKLIKPIVNQALSKVEIPLRRTGKHHPNLWGDDFIQSLPKHPYEAPLYAERCGGLISEIKDMFSASAENVSPLLGLVDNIERLGIDRHFQKEIKEALDFIYRHWGECQRDLNITALGFRILRLHRYPVSPGMLGAFRTANGQFLCSTAQTEEDKIKGILNLFRASHIAFRGEKILDEAKEFSTTYLNQAMEKSGISSNLLQEISFNLEYGWYNNLPRLEAKKYIQIYGENESWARMAGNEKLLLLAKMDFNAIQSLHQQELKTYSRWWRESGLSKLEFARHRHVEYFFMACAICEDERYAAFRYGVAKFSSIATYLDDIYDTYGTIDELKLLTKAIKKWDPTSIDHLPEYMKVLYMALYETINEMDREAEKIQGRDTLTPSRDVWEGYANAMMQEAEWLATSHIPTLAEHIENGTVSSGTRATTLQPVLTIDEILSENILPKIDYPSRFMDLLCMSLRLRGDIKSFKGEIARGETNSSVACYMRDNPGSIEEDALDYIKNLLDERLKELNWEYLKNDGVPTCSKDYAYDITRGYLHFYKERDGFSISNKDIQNHVTQILIEPINM
ncbi:alpha pinene synthase, chloroplastic-like [Cryptomeria japonica]|uniref:alpha pinene synthase, chloroplastic-like n=1 Tax=Cryptomeria japonica TaxID=3369 RepID=UPI0027DA2F12|nr:alpha pinene synthase, chloroplastic-like [Cryptomeria japonica]